MYFFNETAGHWFQSTPPREGVTHLYKFLAFFYRFQSTPPREGVTKTVGSGCRYECVFQSTPPREGVTDPEDTTLYYGIVSIHTPP